MSNFRGALHETAPLIIVDCEPQWGISYPTARHFNISSSPSSYRQLHTLP